VVFGILKTCKWVHCIRTHTTRRKWKEGKKQSVDRWYLVGYWKISVILSRNYLKFHPTKGRGKKKARERRRKRYVLCALHICRSRANTICRSQATVEHNLPKYADATSATKLVLLGSSGGHLPGRNRPQGACSLVQSMFFFPSKLSDRWMGS
jgi:hypothetical protein